MVIDNHTQASETPEKTGGGGFLDKDSMVSLLEEEERQRDLLCPFRMWEDHFNYLHQGHLMLPQGSF